jgi:hypothetical protein
MHDLRDICASLRGKFQVAKIISDAQTVHSWYKYIRKFRAKGSKKLRGGFLSFIFCMGKIMKLGKTFMTIGSPKFLVVIFWLKKCG